MNQSMIVYTFPALWLGVSKESCFCVLQASPPCACSAQYGKILCLVGLHMPLA